MSCYWGSTLPDGLIGDAEGGQVSPTAALTNPRSFPSLNAKIPRAFPRVGESVWLRRCNLV